MNQFYKLNSITRIFFIFLFLNQFIHSTGLQAQISSYAFAPNIVTPYSEIAGGTVIATATSASGSGSLDDTIYSLPNGTIPFSFSMNNFNYTGFKLSSNGFITFGDTLPTITNYTPLSATENYSAAISLFAININSYFYLGNATQNGELRYQTLGVAPNRIFVIQWKNFKRATTSNTPYGTSINGQIRLYETSNVIQLVYRITAAIAGSSAQVGLRGATNTFPSNINNRAVAAGGNWNVSTAGAGNTSICSFATTFPISGLIYQFTPPCFTPVSLSASSIAQNSAQLNWSSTVAGTFKVEYGLNGFVLGTGTIVNNAVSPLSISGLTAGSNYQFYVTQTCALGGTSAVSSAKSFATLRIGDNCETAPTILVDSSLTVVQSGNSQDGPNSICSDYQGGNYPDDDMWFKFVAPAGGKKIVVTSTAGTNGDWVMEIWTGCVGTGSVIKCNDDNTATGSGMPEVSLCQNEYVAGQTYYVRIWTYGLASSGTMNLRAYKATACIIPPANDNCINAISLPIGIPLSCPSSSQQFTNIDGTASSTTPLPTCGVAVTNDVFFKFNTGNFGSFNLTIKPISAVSVYAQLLFDCIGTSQIQCYTVAAGGSTFTINTGSNAGEVNPSADVLLRIWTPSNSSGTFEICLSDICDDATAIISSVPGSNSLCPTGTVPLRVDFTGIPPWNFTYTNGSTNTTLTASTTPFYFNVSPVVTTTYSLVSMNSQYCAGTVSGFATIQVIQPPTVTLSAFSPVCSNVTNLSLTGGSPSGGSYSGVGVTGGVFNASIAGPGTFPIVYTYEIGIGCARSATQNILVKPAPTITSFNPGIGPIGSTVAITGTNYIGVSTVKFNGTNASPFTVNNPNSISAVIAPGTTSGLINIVLTNGCSTTSNTIFAIGSTPVNTFLTVKAFIQGFYLGGGTMQAVLNVNQPAISDSVKVSLARATSPYDIMAVSKGVLGTNGIGNFAFQSSMAGSSYYVVINHRNCIETWSASPVLLSNGGASIDFTVPRTLLRMYSPTEIIPSGRIMVPFKE